MATIDNPQYPTVGGDDGAWGGKLNTLLQALVSQGNAQENGKVSTPSGGSDGQALLKSGSTVAWGTVSGSGASYTDEQAQDAAAALLTSGTHTGITFAYDDAGNRVNATVTASGGGGGGTSRFGSAVRNVKLDYGAVGDGTTDDTAAIQAAFNGLTENTAVTVYFPRGTYKLTDAIKIPFAPGLRIIGDGGEQITKLVQYTAGKSILWFSRSITHSVFVADLHLTYDTNQTNVNSWAVRYWDDTDSGASWFKHVYERITVTNAYRGFAIDTSAGAPTCWNFEWNRCRAKGMRGSFVMIRGANPNGQPINVLRNILIENTNTSIISTEAVFDFGANEVLLDQVDVEGWASPIIDMTNGTFVTMRGIHIEQHQFITAEAYLFKFVNTSWSLDGFSVDGRATAAVTDKIAVFSPQAASPGRVENGLISVGTNLSGAYVKEVLWRADQDTTYPPIVWGAGVRVGPMSDGTANGLALPGKGSRAVATLKSLQTLGAMPDGTRGTALPFGAPLYLYDSNGDRWAVTVTTAGALSIVKTNPSTA